MTKQQKEANMGRPSNPDPSDRPAVLFLCVHNAGRSQMALGWLRHLGGGQVTGYSGGSEPANVVNPVAVRAMTEVGIDIASEAPKRWTDEMVRAVDVVVSMGCGDTCPYYPGKRYVDWTLQDPAGADIEFVRTVRDEIRTHVEQLLAELRITPSAATCHD
jgi:arsenate reductase (thioredoxin)